MKNNLFLLAFLLLLCFRTVQAQNNTEVYLFDIVEKQGELHFENRRNVSNSNGYDNQPSFYDNDNILFSATRNGQTDIAKYNISNDSLIWITNTPTGNEYSPLRIPNSDDISTVRLDTSGLQRLYRYDAITQESELLIKDLKVGYHLWDTDEQLITAVLVKNGMNLMLNYLPENKNNTIDKSVGRCLQKIPGSDLKSFISLNNATPMISTYDATTGEVKNLINIPSKTEDMCWLDKGSVLIPNGKLLMRSYIDRKKPLEVLYEFKEREVHNISRIAISPNGKHLVLVSDENPEMMADKQVNTFNSGNLNAFVECFSDSVVISNFPDKILYTGRSNMKINYGGHFNSNLNTKIEIANRIVINDIIIDEEIIRENEEEFHRAAIYQVERGYISNMTFINESKKDSELEEVIQNQLKSYNARNLTKYLKYFSDDVETYNYPNQLTAKGKEAFGAKYQNLFTKATDLNCEITNQIVVGNIVINEEMVEFGNAKFRTIAIYEISNNLIKKVTFIR